MTHPHGISMVAGSPAIHRASDLMRTWSYDPVSGDLSAYLNGYLCNQHEDRHARRRTS